MNFIDFGNAKIRVEAIESVGVKETFYNAYGYPTSREFSNSSYHYVVVTTSGGKHEECFTEKDYAKFKSRLEEMKNLLK